MASNIVDLDNIMDVFSFKVDVKADYSTLAEIHLSFSRQTMTELSLTGGSDPYKIALELGTPEDLVATGAELMKIGHELQLSNHIEGKT